MLVLTILFHIFNRPLVGVPVGILGLGVGGGCGLGVGVGWGFGIGLGSKYINQDFQFNAKH
jgi:hypothetical protein